MLDHQSHHQRKLQSRAGWRALPIRLLSPYLTPPGRSRGTHESIVKLREAPRKRAPCATARRAVQEGSLLGSWEPGEMAYVLSGLCCWLLHHRNCMRCCSIAMEATCEKRVGVSTVCEPQFNFNFLGSSWYLHELRESNKILKILSLAHVSKFIVCSINVVISFRVVLHARW